MAPHKFAFGETLLIMTWKKQRSLRSGKHPLLEQLPGDSPTCILFSFYSLKIEIRALDFQAEIFTAGLKEH